VRLGAGDWGSQMVRDCMWIGWCMFGDKKGTIHVTSMKDSHWCRYFKIVTAAFLYFLFSTYHLVFSFRFLVIIDAGLE